MSKSWRVVARVHRGPCWLRPQSLAGTVALFVAGYLVWQPLVAGVLLPWVSGHPRLPAATWPTFLMLLVPLGAAAGALWWGAGRMPRDWRRGWLRGASRVLALATLIDAPSLRPGEPGRWTLGVVLTAVVVGGVFGRLERWDDPPAAPSAPAA